MTVYILADSAGTRKNATKIIKMTELKNSNATPCTYFYSRNKQPEPRNKEIKERKIALPLVECRALIHSAPDTHTSQSPSLEAIISKSTRATKRNRNQPLVGLFPPLLSVYLNRAPFRLVKDNGGSHASPRALRSSGRRALSRWLPLATQAQPPHRAL